MNKRYKTKLLTVGWWMLIIEGAIDILTGCHWSWGIEVMSLSIDSFIISIPVALDTWVDPRYWALSIFFGSSMGVGKDWAVKLYWW